MTRAGRKTDAATTLLMVLLILTAVKLLLERLLALMLPHDLHQNTRLLLSMAQEALLIGLPALLMRRGRSARTGTMRLSIGLLLCAAVLGLAMRALATPLTQLWGNFLSAPERQIAADGAGEWCLQLLALAVLPAVLEEALFRGVVLQTLLDSGSRFGAWLLTTLFFSLLHGNLAALPAHLLFGGALTLAEMRTGNLLVPMVMHAVYNASALFWRGMSSGWLIFCGAAVLALGIWALMTLPRTAKMRMKRGHIMLSAAILLLMAVQYLLYKLTAFLAGIVTQGALAELINALGTAFGLMLGMTGVTLKVDLVISLTLIVEVTLAKMFGCSLPIIALRLKLDPAVMSSPFVTTIVDAISLLIYYGFATAVLHI